MRRDPREHARKPSRPRPGLRPGLGLAALILLGAGPAAAQNMVEPDRTYVYSNTGVILPTPAPAYGQDEVQAAGGVACRSSVGGGGAYLDMGLVGSEDPYRRNTTSAYARLVVPLGRRPARIDCTQLFQLEIERLRMELELARMSLPAMGARTIAASATTAFPPAREGSP